MWCLKFKYVVPEIQSNAVYQGEFVTGDYNLFTALQQNLSNHKFKTDSQHAKCYYTKINMHPRNGTASHAEQDI
jgi:hypothetical protein